MSLDETRPTTDSGPQWRRIEDAGVLLRPVASHDAPGLLAVHGDPRVYEFDPIEVHHDLDQTRRFLEPMISHWDRHGFGYWTTLVPRSWWPTGVTGADPDDHDRVVGGLAGIQHHTVAGEPVLNVYYRFAPDVQGRGLAGLVLRWLQTVAPTIAPGVDLVVRTRPANAAARRVAERAGFIDLGLEPGTTDMQLLRWSS